jgi:hypothetical protein
MLSEMDIQPPYLCFAPSLGRGGIQCLKPATLFYIIRPDLKSNTILRPNTSGPSGTFGSGLARCNYHPVVSLVFEQVSLEEFIVDEIMAS